MLCLAKNVKQFKVFFRWGGGLARLSVAGGDARRLPISLILGKRVRATVFNQRNTYSQQGFTLIELMVTIAIAAILLAVAVPSFQDSIRRNRVATVAGNLVSALDNARAEAIRRAVPVYLCPSTSGTDCTATAWHDGWIMYFEPTAGTKTVLQVGNAVSAVSVSLTVGASPVQYTSRGMLSAAVTFQVQPESCEAPSKYREIAVGVAGRSSVSEVDCS